MSVVDASATTARDGALRRSALILTANYWPEEVGSGPIMTGLAEWLARKGTDVQALTNRPHYPDIERFPDFRSGAHDRQVVQGVRLRRAPTRFSGGGSAYARLRAEAAFFGWLLWRRLSDGDPRRDLVITLCPSALTVLAGALGFRGRARHVAIVHDIPSGLAETLKIRGADRFIRMLRAIERTAFNRADLVVVLTDAMKAELEANGVVAPIAVIPPFADTDRVTPRPRPDGAPPTVLYSGNLGKKQGLGQVLAMAQIVQQRRPEVRFLIRGNGSERRALEADAAARGLTNVEFRDLAPAAALNESLAEGDVHLVPQVPEGARFAVPSKIFTIMAAGRPFICTAASGSPLHALMERSGAFLCSPPNDPDCFAADVIDLLDDPGRRGPMGQSGRSYVLAEASHEVVLGRLARILFSDAA